VPSLFEGRLVGQLRPAAVLVVTARWVTDDCLPLEVEADPAGIRQVGPRQRARERGKPRTEGSACMDRAAVGPPGGGNNRRSARRASG
jgi:hypothetical protein